MRARRIAALLTATATALPLALAASPAAALVPHGPAVLHVGQIGRQDVAAQPKSEPDTLVEPDVAVDPYNSSVAVAVAHDGRFPDGGAVAISYARTRNGGASWHHAPVPKVTTATGGRWPRASDPVLAFGPDGSVYLSILVFDPNSCRSGIAVLRSTNGGATWRAPVFADRRTTCEVDDDKNWIVVDTHPTSPFYGRIYQFWTPFLSAKDGTFIGDPQWVRWSDDKGQHWSAAHHLGAASSATQDSQPMIQPDGTIVDAYQRFSGAGGERPENPFVRAHTSARTHAAVTPGARAAATGAAPADTGLDFVARTSTDGGATWSAETDIGESTGEGPDGVRCCLPSATADHGRPPLRHLDRSWQR